LLEDDLLDVVGRKAAFDQRRPHMHAEFFPSADGHHGADDQDAAHALVEMWTCPDLAPGAAGDEILKLGIEGVAVGISAIDPRVSQDFSARLRALSVALLVVHCVAPRVRGQESRVGRQASRIGLDS
jgi:hypothetical protein